MIISGAPTFGPVSCKVLKKVDFGEFTGSRMAPFLYSTRRTGDGPGAVHGHGGPVPTGAIGAVWGLLQNF